MAHNCNVWVLNERNVFMLPTLFVFVFWKANYIWFGKVTKAKNFTFTKNFLIKLLDSDLFWLMLFLKTLLANVCLQSYTHIQKKAFNHKVILSLGAAAHFHSNTDSKIRLKSDTFSLTKDKMCLTLCSPEHSRVSPCDELSVPHNVQIDI